MVHTLQGKINQVRRFYECTNPDCAFSQSVFNIHPRFDYGKRHYGADVFRWIADKFLIYQTSKKAITKELQHKYHLKISYRTVRRVCDDILNLKAWKIDQETAEILLDDPRVLIGVDGQDPGQDGKALWAFFDLMHNRVLHTCVVETLDHQKLHEILEHIRQSYNVSFLGFVSDKQNLITKCMQTFYPNLPHQYCQFHFLSHLWKHAETVDSRVYGPLKKTVNKLYIHRASHSETVHFEGKGYFSVREVFKSIDTDLQIMLKVRNKKFKTFRGIWLYEKLQEYTEKLREIAAKLEDSYRFTKIFKRTLHDLEEGVQKVEPYYRKIKLMQLFLTQIRDILKHTERGALEQQLLLDEIFGKVWEAAKNFGLDRDLSQLRAFLPKKNRSPAEILGEWCRLWESYRPGLFQYLHFPKAIKTNNQCENAFSQEVCALVKESGKAGVGLQIQARGEARLRLLFCEEWELETDIVAEYSEGLIQALRQEQQDRISAVTSLWRKESRKNLGYKKAVKTFYPEAKEIIWVQADKNEKRD
jgi:hypothetical protein